MIVSYKNGDKVLIKATACWGNAKPGHRVRCIANGEEDTPLWMLNSVTFYIACVLGAALIYVMIQYGKEIEHNRELDKILVELLEGKNNDTEEFNR